MCCCPFYITLLIITFKKTNFLFKVSWFTCYELGSLAISCMCLKIQIGQTVVCLTYNSVKKVLLVVNIWSIQKYKFWIIPPISNWTITSLQPIIFTLHAASSTSALMDTCTSEISFSKFRGLSYKFFGQKSKKNLVQNYFRYSTPNCMLQEFWSKFELISCLNQQSNLCVKNRPTLNVEFF